MNEAPQETRLPPGLRLLKGLVIALTVTMIAAVITVAAVIVTRMPTPLRPLPVLPDTISLPQGARAATITFGEDWIAVVTTDERILVYRQDGTLIKEVAINAP